MAKVKIQGHASGTGILTVTAPNTSTDRTITLPDATGTLLNSDGSGASLTSLPAAQVSGTHTNFTSTGIDDNATSTAITINATENVGIEVTPESWEDNYPALQIGGQGSLGGHSGSEVYVNENVYRNGGAWKHINTAAASQYTGTGGQHKFKVAPSASADAAITWTTAMTIDNSGRVTMPLQPSFLANGSPSKDGSNFIHSFANIKYNIGSHYVNSNGRFTAPVAGRYLFIAGIFAQASTDNMLAILINGSGDYAGAHVFNESGQTSTGNISVVLNLAVNDYVSVACDYNVQGSTPRNFFSGILIG